MKREKRDSKDPNKSVLNPATTQVIDSSPSSPQPSSSKFSSITKDIAMATRTNMVADGNVTSSEAYAETSGDFWTEPFSADNSYIPSDFLTPFMDTEYLSPVLAKFLCPYALYEEIHNLINLSSHEKSRPERLKRAK